MSVQGAQSCQTLCNPLDCSPPGSSFCPWNFPDRNTGLDCLYAYHLNTCVRMIIALSHCMILYVHMSPLLSRFDKLVKLKSKRNSLVLLDPRKLACLSLFIFMTSFQVGYTVLYYIIALKTKDHTFPRL